MADPQPHHFNPNSSSRSSLNADSDLLSHPEPYTDYEPTGILFPVPENPAERAAARAELYERSRKYTIATIKAERAKSGTTKRTDDYKEAFGAVEEGRGEWFGPLLGYDDEPAALLPSDVSKLNVSRNITEAPKPAEPCAMVSPERTATTPLDPEVAPPGKSGSETDAPISADLTSSPARSTDSATEPTDFEKYVQKTKDDENKPLRPRVKSPSSASTSSTSKPIGLRRPGSLSSLYTLSFNTFSDLISQLTSIPLPQPSTLEATIGQISNATAAVKALAGSAEQMQTWIKKAGGILRKMEADDDVYFGAATGRSGLDEVDQAIGKFESVVNVYVKAIEDIQLRQDFPEVSSFNQRTIVVQMDKILSSWMDIKSKLKEIRHQTELAMEFEDLFSDILGNIGLELRELDLMVFQMEEKRHRDTYHDPQSSGNHDEKELETIVEEAPSDGRSRPGKRICSLPDVTPDLKPKPPQAPKAKDDEPLDPGLLAIYARMQPLKASLDFLPMRLSEYKSRAVKIYPSACEDLEDRRTQFEERYKNLEADVETLRIELVEDKWIYVFDNAGDQARKMIDSLQRTMEKLQESLDTAAHLRNPVDLSKRIESYEAKKSHYFPAIKRLALMILKGINNRKTVNGNLNRLLGEMESKVPGLQTSIQVMDTWLEEADIGSTDQLRDSISSIVTTGSPALGSATETPDSSPASSVVVHPGNGTKGSNTPLGSSRRGSSVGSAARNTLSKVRRHSGLPISTSPISSRKSSIPTPSLGSPTLTPTPATRKVSRPQPGTTQNRPRWNGSTNTNRLDVGHNFRPSSPASGRKSALSTRPARPMSTIPVPSPFSREASMSPAPSTGRSTGRVSSRLTSHSPARPTPSPTPTRSLLDPPPYSKLRRGSAAATPNAPRNRQSFAGVSGRAVSHQQSSKISSPTTPNRPGTSLDHLGNRRSSLLPQPRMKGGRQSSGQSKLDQRPPWR